MPEPFSCGFRHFQFLEVRSYLYRISSLFTHRKISVHEYLELCGPAWHVDVLILELLCLFAIHQTRPGIIETAPRNSNDS